MARPHQRCSPNVVRPARSRNPTMHAPISPSHAARQAIPSSCCWHTWATAPIALTVTSRTHAEGRPALVRNPTSSQHLNCHSTIMPSIQSNVLTDSPKVSPVAAYPPRSEPRPSKHREQASESTHVHGNTASAPPCILSARPSFHSTCDCPAPHFTLGIALGPLGTTLVFRSQTINTIGAPLGLSRALMPEQFVSSGFMDSSSSMHWRTLLVSS
ncbi:hypothetical protein EJ04DRAFT_557061 [Polyplosphaeria fusca]|uniref:Uncharacterized protein n=1 Tax=Polyplosphaeria fusca TaxID=682080 RepID=A0A9P4QIJ6_9PLEO|nr:hypothetical protein EJ04DRAFT_557061 [Polyplosphaeria fusca]